LGKSILHFSFVVVVIRITRKLSVIFLKQFTDLLKKLRKEEKEEKKKAILKKIEKQKEEIIAITVTITRKGLEELMSKMI
jgi:hypothetical protein